jgi:hypothetical protein
MMSELDLISEEIQTRDEGSYFIPQAVLITMSHDQLDQAEKAARLIVDLNPDFIFYFLAEIETGGITIHWKRNI